MKIVVGLSEELNLLGSGHIIDTEMLFTLFLFLMKITLLNTDLFLPKIGIINPYINHK
jgi:hypothetical protein